MTLPSLSESSKLSERWKGGLVKKNMLFKPFEYSDLPCLPEFQPPLWGDLGPRFDYFIRSGFCNPVKGCIGNETVAIGTDIRHRDTVWLACIIVHPGYRNQGLGAAITQYLIDHVDRIVFQTIYLDATDMGYPVYKKLGFELHTVYNHYKRTGPPAELPLPASVVPFSAAHRDAVLKVDEMISGEDRRHTLEEHFEAAQVFLCDGQVTGFYMPSLGDGLIVAQDRMAGLGLMNCRFRDKPFAALPETNKTGNEYLLQNGYEPFRTSRRMILGKERPVQLHHIYNRVSGQLG